MKRTLSILNANILYLLTLLFVITLGSIMQLANLTYGLLGTEFLLILLPAVLFVRFRKVSLRSAFRLHSIRWQTAVLCVLLGFAAWLIGSFIDTLVTELTGLPSVEIPTSSLPQSNIDQAFFFIALAFAAPICEEALFRGAIQTAYENHRTPALAITMASLMFAFYHFRLTGLPALLPVAFVLGYVAWRTGSIFASMLVHFGNNVTSASLSLVATALPNIQLTLLNPITLTAGVVFVILLLLAINFILPQRVGEEALQEQTGIDLGLTPQPRRRSWLSLYWPLVISLILYIALTGLTLYGQLNPELIAQSGFGFEKPEWTKAETYRYQITNRVGNVVGEATCQITPGSQVINLDCQSQIQPYEVKVGKSTYADSGHKSSWKAGWDAQTLALKQYTYEFKPLVGPGVKSTLKNGVLTTVDQNGQSQTVDVPADVFAEYEWPWRMMNAQIDPGMAYRIQLAYPFQFSTELGKNVPQVVPLIAKVIPLDPVNVPAGRFDAWEVSIDNKSAWYDNNTPIRLVKYDDGINFYGLKK